MRGIKRFCVLALLLTFNLPISAALSKSESLYRETYQTEQLGFYGKARQDYYSLCRDILNKKQPNSTTNLTERIPILVSAAFRLGVVTSKTNYFDVHPLAYQLEIFKATDDMLEEVILYMVQQHELHPNLIPKQEYALLFFARAYNRIGWSSKLVYAITWKQYIVHPPSDCVMMLYSAADDLTYLKDSEGATDLEKVNATLWSTRLKKLEKSSLEYRTYQLTNLEDDPDELASIFYKRYTQNVFPTLTYIRSQSVTTALDESLKNSAYQDILSKKNSPLFEVFGEVIKKIGIN